jgi:hypothetical protein
MLQFSGKEKREKRRIAVTNNGRMIIRANLSV